MRHARSEALAELSSLLRRLRDRSALVEKSPGVYYLKSRAFLHFHEDPTGLFADVNLAHDFERFPVSTRSQQAALLKRIDGHLARLARPAERRTKAERK